MGNKPLEATGDGGQQQGTYSNSGDLVGTTRSGTRESTSITKKKVAEKDIIGRIFPLFYTDEDFTKDELTCAGMMLVRVE